MSCAARFSCLVVTLSLSVTFPGIARARWGVKLSPSAVLHPNNAPRTAPPQDPKLYKRVLGLGHDPAIRQGIREAKRAGSDQERDIRLLQLTQNPHTLSKMSLWSATKIAGKTRTSAASDGVLEGFARHYITGLSVGDIVGLSTRLYAIDVTDGMIQRYRAAHPSLSSPEQRSLFRAETLTDGGYFSGVAAVYNPRTKMIERRAAYKSGIAGVYNPTTGEVEWRRSYKSGVAGVYNPSTGQVEWKECYLGGVAGAYNPKDGKVHWATGYKSGAAAVYNPTDGKVHTKVAYMSGVAGAYNPSDGKVYFEASYKAGVAAVYNPKTGKVQTTSGYLDGVAGAYDQQTGQVEWIKNYKGGASAVYHDGVTYRSNGGFDLFLHADEL